MIKRNQEIHNAKGKIPNWVIAEKLNIHESTFVRWLRQELPPASKEVIINVIKQVKNELLDDPKK
jgi:hypothetical protein